MTDLFSATDPYAAAQVLSVEALLDEAATQLQTQPDLSLDARLQLHTQLGDVFAVRLLRRRAQASFEQALALLDDADDDNVIRRLELQRRLIGTKLDLIETVAAYGLSIVAVREAEQKLPAGHPLITRLRAQQALADTWPQERLHGYRLERARRLAESAVAEARQLAGEPRVLVEALEALGAAHARGISLERADALFTEALAVAEAHPAAVPAFSRGQLIIRRAEVRRDLGRHDASLADARRQLDAALTALPPDHPVVLQARTVVAETRLAMGQTAFATNELHAVLELAHANYPATHSVLHRLTVTLATHLWNRGDREAALALWDRQPALALRRDADGLHAADLHNRAGY